MSPRRPPARLRLEPLESRRTPATLAADGKSVSYLDTDGDTVTVAFSKPVLTTAAIADTVFKFNAGTVNSSNAVAQVLQRLDLTGLAGGLSVAVSATGNGTADVGWIKADAKDVGTVTVAGDLGRITAGDANTKTPGLKALDVVSLGVRGLTTQEAGGSLATAVHGPLGKLVVEADVARASVTVTGGKAGTLGPVVIAGSLKADPAAANTGLIKAEGAIKSVVVGTNIEGGGANSGVRSGGALGAVTVGGDVKGGAGDDSGSIVSALGIKSVTVGGSVLGAGGARGAAIVAQGGDLGKVQVLGAVTGETGPASAAIQAYARDGKGGKIKSVAVTGAVAGTGANSAALVAAVSIGSVTVGSLAGAGAGSGSIVAPKLGAVTVVGAVTGGAGEASAAIIGTSAVKSVTIGGTVTGSTGKNSAAVLAVRGSLGAVKIGGDLKGGTGDYSAAIQAFETQVGTKVVGGKIKSVTVTGDLVGGAGSYSGAVYAGAGVGKVLVGGLAGGGGYSSGSVLAPNGTIKSVTVTRGITGGAGILSGSIFTGGKLGAVTVGTDGAPGDVAGGTGNRSASITGFDVAAVTVTGNVTGGTGLASAAVRAFGSLGLVAVDGNWAGASIAAGVDPGADGLFDTPDDDRRKGTIKGITIGGTVNGTVGGVDHFAFIATEIKALSINGVVVALTKGPTNDDLVPATVTTGDFRVVELGPGP